MTRASVEDNPRVSCFQAVVSMSTELLMQCKMGTATIFAEQLLNIWTKQMSLTVVTS